MSVLIN